MTRSTPDHDESTRGAGPSRQLDRLLVRPPQPRGLSALPAILGQALGSLASHPLRSALTGLSVTFGAAVLQILLAYSTGMPDTTADVLRSMGSKEFIVEPRRSWGRSGGSRSGRQVRIRYSDIDTIRAASPSVGAISPAYRPGRGGPAFTTDKSWPWARLTGVGFSYKDVTDLTIVEGRWFTAEEEQQAEELALVSKPLADGLFEGRYPVGERIDFSQRRFEIIGTFESNADFAYSLLVPYPTAMEMGDTGGRYVSHLAFAPRRPDLAKDAIAEIRSALGTIYSFDGNDPNALDVKENTDFVDKVEAVSLGLEVLIFTIAALTLVLGCLGAANVVGIAVAERTSELGLRKAMGATSARVRAEVLAETLLLCVLGGLVGAGIGSTAIAFLGPLEFSEAARLVPASNVNQLLLAGVVLVTAATVAGIPAANRAARLDPVTALREE